MAPRNKAAPLAVDLNGASPHSDEAETAVIAALLKDNSTWDLVSIDLSDRDFYRPENGLIYRVVGELIDAQKSADVISVHERLKQTGKVEEAGGLAYLKALAREIPDVDSIQRRAEIVQENARLRELVSAGYVISASAFNRGEKSVYKLLDEAEHAIFSIAERNSQGQPGFEAMDSLVAQVLAQVRVMADHPSEITGMSTGFYDLDRITSGLQGGELMMVAAHPAMGKTALGLNIAEHVALVEGLPVAVFLMGNDASEITLRLLGSVGRVVQGHLRSGQLGDDEWQRVSEAAGRLSAAPLHIDGAPYCVANRLRAHARRLSRQCGKLGLIIVDDMQQLIGSLGDGGDHRTRIGASVRDLKLLAEELRCPVISLLQLDSIVGSHESWRPVLGDLPDSVAIQQEADTIMFIYREDCYKRDSQEPGVAEFIIAKQRRGPTGLVKMAFSEPLVRFESLAWAGNDE
jgi:replicative DNA helicase